MKRVILLVLLFLLIGAVINVAVAWLIAPLALTQGGGAASAPSHWPDTAPSDWPAPDMGYKGQAFGYDAMAAYANLKLLIDNRSDPSVHSYTMTVRRYGWPLRSLKSIEIAVLSGYVTTRLRESVWRSGVMAPAWANPNGSAARRFAFIPDAVGFVVNSLFYASVAGTCAQAIAIVRRYHRRRRGLCGACGYPIGSFSVCTECGKPVRPRAGATA